MNDIQSRFRRLDRLEAPDLWNEAVGRAAEMELAPRRTFTPGMALIAVALLLAAVAGTIAVGGLLNRQIPQPLNLEHDNGWLTMQGECGAVVGLDPTSFESQNLTSGVGNCDGGGFYAGPVAWTPDGRWMAYLTNKDPEATQAWLYDSRANESRLVGECAYCWAVDISPDGSLIASANGDGLTLLETDGGAAHTLDLAGAHSTPQFSPDGHSLAFTVAGGQTGVHVVDVANVIDGIVSRPTMIHGIVAANDATWSPNGDWIAFSHEASIPESVRNDGTAWVGNLPTTTTLWVVRRDGSDARQLTTGDIGFVTTPPTWSPDSTSIAFVAGRDDTEDSALWTVEIDGGAPTRIYESDCCPYPPMAFPAWSPDGELIAFGIEEPTGRSGLMLVRPDGSDARLVADQGMIAVWQPIPAD